MLKMRLVQGGDGGAGVDWQVSVWCDQCGESPLLSRCARSPQGTRFGRSLIQDTRAVYTWEVNRIGAVRDDGSLSVSAYVPVTGDVLLVHTACLAALMDGESERWVASDIRQLVVDVARAIGVSAVVEGWNE